MDTSRALLSFKQWMTQQLDCMTPAAAEQLYTAYRVRTMRPLLLDFFEANKMFGWMRERYLPAMRAERLQYRQAFVQARLHVFLDLWNGGRFADLELTGKHMSLVSISTPALHPALHLLIVLTGS